MAEGIWALSSPFQGPCAHRLHRRSSLWPCYSVGESRSRFQHATGTHSLHHLSKLPNSPTIHSPLLPSLPQCVTDEPQRAWIWHMHVFRGWKVKSGLQANGGMGQVFSSTTIPQSKCGIPVSTQGCIHQAVHKSWSIKLWLKMRHWKVNIGGKSIKQRCWLVPSNFESSLSRVWSTRSRLTTR